MIFPDEKMIKDSVYEIVQDECEIMDTYSAHEDTGERCAQWAINHIKSAASESEADSFHSWCDSYFGHGMPPSQSYYESTMSAFQAAVISTAAKYEEKLRENNREIDARLDKAYMAGFEVLKPTVEKLQAENEQLKAAVIELEHTLARLWLDQDAKEFKAAHAVMVKYSDLITKINKGSE